VLRTTTPGLAITAEGQQPMTDSNYISKILPGIAAVRRRRLSWVRVGE